MRKNLETKIAVATALVKSANTAKSVYERDFNPESVLFELTEERLTQIEKNNEQVNSILTIVGTCVATMQKLWEEICERNWDLLCTQKQKNYLKNQIRNLKDVCQTESLLTLESAEIDRLANNIPSFIIYLKSMIGKKGDEALKSQIFLKDSENLSSENLATLLPKLNELNEEDLQTFIKLADLVKGIQKEKYVLVESYVKLLNPKFK